MMEDHTDLLSNVKISGPQYTMFCPTISRRRRPIITNTRVYSCILISNDIPFRWRGKYNEDTDLCLRVLKEGYGIVLYDCLPCGKKGTGTCKGGNQKIYSHDGFQMKLDSLLSQHPDVVKTKFLADGRPHHNVNYRPFKDNILGEFDFGKEQIINEYGMKLLSCVII